jgi:uncharacterized membrane protein YkvA (DUF1232 family)
MKESAFHSTSEYHNYLLDLTKGYEGENASLINKIPELYLTLLSLVDSPDLISSERRDLFVVIGYFFIPDDLYPEETLGIDGMVDDLLLTLHVLDILYRNYGSEGLSAYSPIDEKDLIDIFENKFPEYRMLFYEIYKEVIIHTGLASDQELNS